jgi:hypothetical protein
MPNRRRGSVETKTHNHLGRYRKDANLVRFVVVRIIRETLIYWMQIRRCGTESTSDKRNPNRTLDIAAILRVPESFSLKFDQCVCVSLD